MQTDASDAGFTGEIEDEAAAWFARLRGPHAESISSEFEMWAARSEHHRRAYERIARLFDDAEVLKLSGRRRIGDRTNHRRLALLVAASALATIALVATLRMMPDGHVPTAAMEQLAARQGEIRALTLSDGSHVTLDTGSRITVALGDRVRRVKLEAGRARFDVARDSRPFIVEAGAGELQVGSGVFDVAFIPRDQVLVTSLDANLEARPALRHAGLVMPIRPLTGGSILAYTAADFSRPVIHDNAQRSGPDWPSGWASYRSIPLSALVAETNRYAEVPIVIDDPATGRHNVSGRFHLTDTDSVAGNLAEVFDLTVERDGRATHLRARKKNFRSD